MFQLVFKSDFSDFEYVYGNFDLVEWAFRIPRVSALSWHINGYKWISSPAVFEEAEKAGHWEIQRVA